MNYMILGILIIVICAAIGAVIGMAVGKDNFGYDMFSTVFGTLIGLITGWFIFIGVDSTITSKEEISIIEYMHTDDGIKYIDIDGNIEVVDCEDIDIRTTDDNKMSIILTKSIISETATKIVICVPKEDDATPSPSITCPNCNSENAENSKFCPDCGYEIEKKIKCDECGKINEGSNKYCAECGNNLRDKGSN